MTTTLETTVNFNIADTAAMPSITVPANATVSVDADEAEWVAPVISNAYNTIVSLVADQEIWLNGVHRTANEQLYVILQRCYHLYSVMASDKEQNKNIKAAIERHNNERNLGIDTNSHTMTNIIKVVFGADRRRASSYSSALRVALAQKVEVQDLPQFLRDAGGVEEVRRQQANEAHCKCKSCCNRCRRNLFEARLWRNRQASRSCGNARCQRHFDHQLGGANGGCRKGCPHCNLQR
jgi:hypothetical protein